MFSVNYPLSQTEQLFLKTMIVPQKYTDLLLVGNYLDVLNSEEDYERMRSLLVSRIQNLLPGQEPWLLSALDERCRQLREERPNPQMEAQLGERFDRFREELNRLLDSLEAALGARIGRSSDRRRSLRGAELVHQLRRASQLNVNSGQLAGWLCAGMFNKD